MEIASFETGMACPSQQMDPVSDGPGRLAANFVTLRLRTRCGIEGISYAGFVGTSMLKSLHEAVHALAEQTIGDDPHDVESIGARLLRDNGFGAPAGIVTRAAAAVDVALWDIKGKAAGLPLFKLLGGYRQTVPCYASGYLWRSYDADALATHGKRLVKQGFRAMKFRMGAEPCLKTEIRRMQALREAVGDGVDLMVDINQGWDVNRAITAGREMEKCGLYWLEDPIEHQDFDGLARVADALDTPLACGEYYYGIAPFRYLFQHRCVDIAMIDLLRAGGITPWMKIAHMAEAFNLPVVTHLAPEILAHCLAAIPNGQFVEHMPWSLPLFHQDLNIQDGQIVLSDQPGLGLDFDPEALRRFGTAV